MGMAEFTFEGRETLEKEAKPIGGGAHVLVPKDWIGETVAVVRLELEQGQQPRPQGSGLVSELPLCR